MSINWSSSRSVGVYIVISFVIIVPGCLKSATFLNMTPALLEAQKMNAQWKVTRDLRFSRQWRFKLRSSGFWRRVVLYKWSHFTLNVDAALPSEMLVSYNTARRHNPEHLNLNESLCLSSPNVTSPKLLNGFRLNFVLAGQYLKFRGNLTFACISHIL
jgi:hypothetical protein